MSDTSSVSTLESRYSRRSRGPPELGVYLDTRMPKKHKKILKMYGYTAPVPYMHPPAPAAAMPVQYVQAPPVHYGRRRRDGRGMKPRSTLKKDVGDLIRVNGKKYDKAKSNFENLMELVGVNPIVLPSLRFFKYIMMMEIFSVHAVGKATSNQTKNTDTLSVPEIKSIKESLKTLVRNGKVHIKPRRKPARAMTGDEFLRQMRTSVKGKNMSIVTLQLNFYRLKQMRGWGVEPLKAKGEKWPAEWVSDAFADKSNKDIDACLGAPYSSGHPVGMSVSMHRKSFNFEDDEME
jgi:hypothetical protein